MKLIPLTQGQYAKVDDWNYEWLNKWNWIAAWSPKSKSYYAQRTEGRGINQKTFHMARVIMKTPDGLIADHISHETLDNQEHNLRNVTYSQNQWNRKKNSNNSIGEKCIIFEKGRNKYRVLIRMNYKSVFHKRYDTLEEAIKSRDEQLAKYHGEFAYME